MEGQWRRGNIYLTSRKATNTKSESLRQARQRQRQISHVARIHSLTTNGLGSEMGGEGMGLTQTIPIFTSFGPSTPDPWIHREIHKTFYTEDYFCFCTSTLPGQARPCGAYPGGRNLTLTVYLPSSPYHHFGPPGPPSHPQTKPLGDLGLGVGEGGGGGGWKETVMDSISEASSAGPRRCGTTPPQQLPLREVSS